MKIINFVAGAVLGLTGTLATAAEWVDVKDPAALRVLYSNMTFKGKDYLDRPWVGHYRADGRGVMVLQDGTRIPRKWAVEGKDRVCIESQFSASLRSHPARQGTGRGLPRDQRRQ